MRTLNGEITVLLFNDPILAILVVIENMNPNPSFLIINKLDS